MPIPRCNNRSLEDKELSTGYANLVSSTTVNKERTELGERKLVKFTPILKAHSYKRYIFKLSFWDFFLETFFSFYVA